MSCGVAEEQWPATPKAFDGQTMDTIVEFVPQSGGRSERAVFSVAQVSYVDNVLRYIITAEPIVENLILVSAFDDAATIAKKEAEYDANALVFAFFDDTGALSGYDKDWHMNKGLVTETVQLLPPDTTNMHDVNVDCVLRDAITGAKVEETTLSIVIAPTGIPIKTEGILSFSDEMRDYRSVVVSSTPQYTTVLLTYAFRDGKTPEECGLRFDVIDNNKRTMIGASYVDRELEDGLFFTQSLVAPLKSATETIDLWLNRDDCVLSIDLISMECALIPAESIPADEGYLSDIIY